MSLVQFNVWVTAPAPPKDFADTLVAKLVRRGFTVGPLGRRLVVAVSDNPSFVVAISLYREPRDEKETRDNTASGIYDEIVNVMKVYGLKFSSIVITENTGCTWNIGNVSIDAEKKAFETELQKKN